MNFISKIYNKKSKNAKVKMIQRQLVTSYRQMLRRQRFTSLPTPPPTNNHHNHDFIHGTITGFLVGWIVFSEKK